MSTLLRSSWTLVVLAACTGGGNSAAVDAAVDTVADASTDTVPVDADTTDTDGDGVYDTTDVCPTLADPLQVDLDGDGVGWLCDPVESKTMPHTGVVSSYRVAVGGGTAGASFEYGCLMGGCKNTALAVGPGGVNIALTEPWLLGRPTWGWVTDENRVLWSLVDGGLGEQNATNGAYTSRYDGSLSGGLELGTTRFQRDELTVLPSASPTEGHGFIEPRDNGELFIFGETLLEHSVKVLVGKNPTTFLFTNHLSGSTSLQKFVAGAAASETMTIAGTHISAAYEVAPIVTGQGALIGLCADQAGVRYFIPTDGSSLAGQVMGLPKCDVYGSQTKDKRLRAVVAPPTGGSAESGAVFLLDGVMHTLSVDPEGVEVFGSSVPAVIKTGYTGATQALFAVNDQAVLTPIGSGVTESVVSTQSGTIHVVAKRGADRVLFRYRDETVSEVTIPALTAPTEQIAILTTREGAALIGTLDTTFVVPSQTMTVTQVDFREVRGAVRGDATLFSATPTAPASTPALYSYSELGGVPQYTALVPDATTSIYTGALELFDGTATSWAYYVKDGACTLVRPVVSAGTVTLADATPCLDGIVSEGKTVDGKHVLRFVQGANEEIHLFDGDTFTKVAASTSQIRMHIAAPDSTVVLAWSGRDASSNNFLCHGKYPQRCWTPPHVGGQTAGYVPSDPDLLHVVYFETFSGMTRFTSIRSIGTGDRPQPI